MSHRIELHEKWYPNSIEQKYKFTLVRCNVRNYNFLQGKTENFSFNLNIRVLLESVNLFLHVFCVLRSFWQWNTTKSYSQFSSEHSQYFGADTWPCEIWDNLPHRHFFTCNRLTATMFEMFMLLTNPRIRQKDTFQDNITVYCVEKGA